MPFHLDFNPGDFADDLTLFAWDSYPVTGWEKHPTGRHYRIADPAAIGFVHDQMASYSRPLGADGTAARPGELERRAGAAVSRARFACGSGRRCAHGAEFVTTYRFRQPRFGIELFHHGLVGPDGVDASVAGRAAVHAGDR